MKELALSALALVGALAMLGVGTFAWYSDAATTEESAFTSGILNLQIKDNGLADPDPWGDSVNLTWVMDNMVPGETSATNTVTLRNVGTVPADHVDLRFSHVIDESTNPVESDTDPASDWRDLARWIEITDMVYDGVPLRTRCTGAAGWDVNGNGWLDLEDVASPPIAADSGPLDALPAPEAVGGEVAFAMTLSFRPEATDDVQGDILISTVTFTLNQHRNQ